MEICGYFFLLLTGIILGLVGAGGSILTIPILIYIFKIPVLLATTYSLFLVGATALMGVWHYRKLISFSKACIFLIPSLIGVSLARLLILPHLPNVILGIKLDTILVMFLLIMMSTAAYFMLKEPVAAVSHDSQCNLSKRIKIIPIGFVVGLISGILGAGGGFLIIPALTLLDITTKQATATSIFIITLNSIIGFTSDQHSLHIADYRKLCLLTVIAWLGMGIGSSLNNQMSDHNLKKVFGWTIISVVLVTAIKELWPLLSTL
jgi:uncharacterized membrane protein YfcA